MTSRLTYFYKSLTNEQNAKLTKTKFYLLEQNHAEHDKTIVLHEEESDEYCGICECDPCDCYWGN